MANVGQQHGQVLPTTDNSWRTLRTHGIPWPDIGPEMGNDGKHMEQLGQHGTNDGQLWTHVR